MLVPISTTAVPGQTGPRSEAMASSSSCPPSSSSFQFSSPQRSRNASLASLFTSSPPRHDGKSAAESLPTSPQPTYPEPEKATRAGIPLLTRNQVVVLKQGETIHIGRKLKASQLAKDGSIPRMFGLPKEVKHASRHHCSIRVRTAIVDGEYTWQLQLQVFGQNGMQINGKKVAKGDKEINLASVQDIFRLGFYSEFEVQLRIEQDEDDSQCVAESWQESRAGTIPPSSPGSLADFLLPATSDLSLAISSNSVRDTSSIPPSSPPARVLTRASSVLSLSDAPSDEERAAPRAKISEKLGKPRRVAQPKKRTVVSKSILQPKKVVKQESAHMDVRSSSPAPCRKKQRASSESAYAHQEDNGYPSTTSSESEDGEDEKVIRARADAEALRVVNTIKKSLSEDAIDLIGSVCSSMVFQARATLTTTEILSLLFENHPNFLAYSSDNVAWRTVLLSVLRTGPFGSIENCSGTKDASGRKLETSWHYAPSLDEDATRKQELAPFVKTVRSTQREKKQYYYRPLTDLKRKRER